MDKKTILIGVVLLFVIGIVAFNLEKFTGKATTSNKVLPKIYLSANPGITDQQDCTVKAGSKVYITAETGSKGIRRQGSIYNNNDKVNLRRASIEFDQNCGGGSCRANKVTWADYKTTTSWKGNYCVKVVQLGDNEAVSKCFTII